MYAIVDQDYRLVLTDFCEIEVRIHIKGNQVQWQSTIRISDGLYADLGIFLGQ